MIKINIVPREQCVPTTGVNTAYLHVDRWNDFSFVTMFYLSLHDEKGVFHELGNVKIGFKGQTTEKSTYSLLGTGFQQLPDEYFSVGQDVDYYQKFSVLTEPLRNQLLGALKDIVHIPELVEFAQQEDVFRTSLLRDVSLSVIKGQFSRVLVVRPPLTNFEFKFVRPEADKMSGIELEFKVEVGSKPSTNIHTVIGRNGVGKTTLLNGMIEAITSKGQSEAKFHDIVLVRVKPIDTEFQFENLRDEPMEQQWHCYL